MYMQLGRAVSGPCDTLQATKLMKAREIMYVINHFPHCALKAQAPQAIVCLDTVDTNQQTK
jgi:hypothetical protein